MELVEGFFTIIEFIKVLSKLADVINAGYDLMRKFYDDTGKVITQFVKYIDSNGDGSFDSEAVVFSLPLTIPKLDSYCLVNYGNEIGLGYPALKLLDGKDVISFFNPSFNSDSDIVLMDFDLSDGMDIVEFVSDGDGILADLDGDGFNDDIFYPSPFDYTGDGINDFYQIVDADDNGLPDLGPGSPFYPVGSEEYNHIIETQSDSEVPALDKSFANYTVTEALLFLIFISCAIGVVAKLFKRRKM